MIKINIGLDETPIVSVDWSKVISIDNGMAEVHLPNHYQPSKIGDSLSMFGINFCQVNLPSLGVPHTADELALHWKRIADSKMELDYLSHCLIAADAFKMIMTGVAPAFPQWLVLPELVSLLASLQASPSVFGVNLTFRAWNRTLRAEANKPVSPKSIPKVIQNWYKQVHQVQVSLSSWRSELRVADRLAKMGYSVSFQSTGPDFMVGDQGINQVKVEVKSRFETEPEYIVNDSGQQMEPQKSSANREGLLIALSLLLSDRFVDGFDRQGCDLLVQDVSGTIYGFLLHAVGYFDQLELTFEEAVQKAFIAVSQGDKSLVAFAYASGSKQKINAVWMTRTAAEEFAAKAKVALKSISERPNFRGLVDLFSNEDEGQAN